MKKFVFLSICLFSTTNSWSAAYHLTKGSQYASNCHASDLVRTGSLKNPQSDDYVRGIQGMVLRDGYEKVPHASSIWRSLYTQIIVDCYYHHKDQLDKSTTEKERLHYTNTLEQITQQCSHYLVKEAEAKAAEAEALTAAQKNATAAKGD